MWSSAGRCLYILFYISCFCLMHRNCILLPNKRPLLFLPFKNFQLPRNIYVCVCACVHMRIAVQEFQSPGCFIGSSGISSAMVDLSHIELNNLGRLKCPMLSCITACFALSVAVYYCKAWHSPIPSLLLTQRNELITRKRDKNEI